MSTQTHEATGTSPYELVFGQKPISVIFPSKKSVGVLEEELEKEGVYFSDVGGAGTDPQERGGEMKSMDGDGVGEAGTDPQERGGETESVDGDGVGEAGTDPRERG